MLLFFNKFQLKKDRAGHFSMGVYFQRYTGLWRVYLSTYTIRRGLLLVWMFILRAIWLSSKLLKQEYFVDRLKLSFMKFYRRYGDLIQQYEVTLSRVLNDNMTLHQQWLSKRSDFPSTSVVRYSTSPVKERSWVRIPLWAIIFHFVIHAFFPWQRARISKCKWNHPWHTPSLYPVLDRE